MSRPYTRRVPLSGDVSHGEKPSATILPLPVSGAPRGRGACQREEQTPAPASGLQLTEATAGTGEPAPAPTPVGECISEDETASIALQHVSAAEAISLDELDLYEVMEVSYYRLTGVSLRTVIIATGRTPTTAKKFVVPVDCGGRVIADLEAVRAAGRQAAIAKYDKLEPALFEFLQTLGPNDMVELRISVRGEERALEAIVQQIQDKHPEAHLIPGTVRPSRETPLDLFLEVIDPEYSKELEKLFISTGTPLAEWLMSLGYEARASSAFSFVYAVVPKHLVQELEAREDVLGIDRASQYKDIEIVPSE